ncbi:protein containing Ribonucleotide reductase large subunit, partial [mine drainage metagenome]
MVIHLHSESKIQDYYNFSLLGEKTRQIVDNLNVVIDDNFYPLDKIVDGEIKPKRINKTNKHQRAIGIGVTGFADLIYSLDLSFEDPRVSEINKLFFSCVYWNAIFQSVQLSILRGYAPAF